MSAGKTAQGLVAYCRAQLGRPYWMGTFGQTATAALFREKRAQCPGYYTDGDFAGQYGQRVHDCIGLVKGYLWSSGPEAAPVYAAGCLDLSADQMLARCRTRGPIGTLPDTPGVLVFMPGHVGIYAGSARVIEARGHRWGVVETPLYGRGWTEWGLCPYINYEEDAMDGKEIYEKLMAYTASLPAPDWAAAELREAVEAGITDGAEPMRLIPRYQAALMALRAAKGVRG